MSPACAFKNRAATVRERFGSQTNPHRLLTRAARMGYGASKRYFKTPAGMPWRLLVIA
jgi:hypothetical protein